MRTRRPSGSLLLSLAIHVVAGIALVNVVFHYDFSGLGGSRSPAPSAERITYVAVAPAGGATGGTTAAPPPKATVPSHGLVAPVRVPDRIAPAAPAAGGTRGGVTNGTGAGGGQGATTGIVPGEPDPRLSADAHQFVPVPKT
ncbi:MAG TPA: hypothetical protein VGG78_05690, partial [Gemmatimonadaceae bacterium]